MQAQQMFLLVREYAHIYAPIYASIYTSGIQAFTQILRQNSEVFFTALKHSFFQANSRPDKSKLF